VTRASTDDHGDRRLVGQDAADDTAWDGAHPPAVRGYEALDRLLDECSGIVVKESHDILGACRLLA
jgi:hypothetical protein